MQPYSLRSAQIARDSSIAVMVLLNHDATDMQFWPIRPRRVAQSAFTSPEEFAARQLRPVGVVGLSGLKSMCAFKEPLEPPVVEAIAGAFMAYIRTLLGLGDSFAEQMGTQLERQQAGDFVQFAEALWSLEDPRLEA
jgi:hypothetical protein